MCAGHIDTDLIRPTITVEVGGKIDEAVAIAFRGIELFDRLNFVRRPPGRLIPEVSRHNIGLTVAVDIGDGNTFRAELTIQNNLLNLT
jgi:hypothetical protein